MSDLYVSKAFKDVWNTVKPTIVLVGGRLGGKTKFVINKTLTMILGEEQIDGVVCRSSYGSLRDSSYSEYVNAIQELQIENYFHIIKSPLRIVCLANNNTIYFTGYGGSNTARTKGFKPNHKLGFVVFEETQELKDRQNLEDAMASFRRNYADSCKTYILGNPPPQKAHWFNLYVEELKQDKTCMVKVCTWKDIVPFINDFDLTAILKTKMTNKKYYDWFYMGETTGGFGAIYPMYQRDKYLISDIELRIILNTLKIICVVIGGDGAVNNDCTAFVPMLILSNGQCVIPTMDIFYHDPKVNGVLGSHQLVTQQMIKWFDNFCKKFNLGTIYDVRNNPYGANQIIDIYMRIDSAATDLIKECQMNFGDRVMVNKIVKSTIMEMVSTVQSAIGNDYVYLCSNYTYYNYTKNEIIRLDNDLLGNQLELMVWDDTQTKYNPVVPNDVCDAFTYGIRFWYGNIENMSIFNILKSNNSNLPLISAIINRK